MISGVLGIVSQLGIVTWLKGDAKNLEPLSADMFSHNESILTLTCCALMSFAYPPEYRKPKKILGYLFMSGTVLLFTSLSSLSIKTLATGSTSSPDNFVAVPILKIMADKDLSKIIPAVACMLVLACSGAIMELFPEMYSMIVKLTSSDWKILAKQVGYENRETGSPVLAIFTGGSLCAMLAFACPLVNLIYIQAGAHLLAVILRTFYLIYSPFRPKCQGNHPETTTSLSYSRLDTHQPTSSSVNVISIPNIKNLWKRKSVDLTNFGKSKRSKNKNKQNGEEVEKEWLLLGEPQSPRMMSEQGPDFSIGSAETQPIQSDVEILLESKFESNDDNDSSSSTDIDIIVDEYRQKVKVTTAGPMDGPIQLPSKHSWRFCIFSILLLFSGIILVGIGIFNYNESYLIGGSSNIVMSSIFLSCTPKHSPNRQGNPDHPNVIIGVAVLASSALLFALTLSESWPAILFWVTAGLAFFIRCDAWCCGCLDRPDAMGSGLIGSEVRFF